MQMEWRNCAFTHFSPLYTALLARILPLTYRDINEKYQNQSKLRPETQEMVTN
jgi:hypothetical protein